MEDRKRRQTQSGVTLIEMLVVVTIIALFAALVMPKLFNKADTARITAARAQINGFMTALGSYKLDTSTWPTTEQGLKALRVRPENVPQWQGPYLPQEVRICRRKSRSTLGRVPTSTSFRESTAMSRTSSHTERTASRAEKRSMPTS